jgi:hypothetical protein
LVIRSASCSDGFYHAYPVVPGIVPVPVSEERPVLIR